MRPWWLAGLVLAGCAHGDVRPLVRGEEPVIAGSLEGGPWLVEDVNGGGVIDNARLDASFAGGQVSGRSGCNRYSGRWVQEGAAIRLGPLAGTRKACAPALMDLEGKFLAALEAARTVEFDATGAGYLRAPDGRVVKVRRE